MRKEITVEIDGTEVTLKELTLGNIKELLESDDAIMDRIDIFLKYGSDLEMDKLLEFAPSDLEELWSKFQEVNKTFFGIARRMGLGKMIDEVATQIPDLLTAELANLFAPDTDLESGTTDSHSS